MPEATLTATILHNIYGGFFAWLRGWGYSETEELPAFDEEPRAAEDALDALVERGYVLQDPGHLVSLYDLFPDEPLSVAGMDADSAGYPGMSAYAGGVRGDNGRGLGDGELVF